MVREVKQFICVDKNKYCGPQNYSGITIPIKGYIADCNMGYYHQKTKDKKPHLNGVNKIGCGEECKREKDVSKNSHHLKPLIVNGPSIRVIQISVIFSAIDSRRDCFQGGRRSLH